MYLNRYSAKKRKGATSILEVVACVAILALMLLSLTRMLSLGVSLETNSQTALQQKEATDEFIDIIQLDIKSAEYLEATGDAVTIEKSESIVIYQIVDNVIYRNSDIILTGFSVAAFVPTDEDTVTIQLKFPGGELMDIVLNR